MNEQTNTNQTNGQGNIMKELSDIKSSLAVNTSETTNIKASIAEIKGDIKEIKTRYITWEQHNDVIKCNEKQEEKIEALESFRDTLIGKMWAISFIVGIVGFIFEYLLRSKI